MLEFDTHFENNGGWLLKIENLVERKTLLGELLVRTQRPARPSSLRCGNRRGIDGLRTLFVPLTHARSALDFLAQRLHRDEKKPETFQQVRLADVVVTVDHVERTQVVQTNGAGEILVALDLEPSQFHVCFADSR